MIHFFGQYPALHLLLSNIGGISAPTTIVNVRNTFGVGGDWWFLGFLFALCYIARTIIGTYRALTAAAPLRRR